MNIRLNIRPALLLAAGCFLFPAAMDAQAPRIQELRVQKVGDITYFHVALNAPADLRAQQQRAWHGTGRTPIQPRLVPQDGKTRAVYQRWVQHNDVVPPFVQGYLEFVGKVEGKGQAKLLLQYPRKSAAEKPKEAPTLAQVLDDQANWAEEPITLDLGRAVAVEARKVKLPVELQLHVPTEKASVWVDGKPTKTEGFHRTYRSAPLEPGQTYTYHFKASWREGATEKTAERKVRVIPGTSLRVNLGVPWYSGPESSSPLEEPAADQKNHRNDLARMWAAAQMYHFAQLEAHAPQTGFYSFACETTGVRHGVALTEDARPRSYWGDNNFEPHLYQVSSDADGLLGPMTILRLRQGGLDPRPEARSVDIRTIRGTDAPEFPWGKKLAAARPDIEPLAGMVPHDNYFVHFKNMSKLHQAGDLIEQWSGGLTWFLDNSTHGWFFKERIEQQLCFKIDDKLTSALIKGVVVTGSDPYLREGSDVTLLFKVANPDLFHAAMHSCLDEVRKTVAGKLKDETAAHENARIDSLVSPLREISLHRTVLDGDVVVISNSPVGIRRVIDAHKGKIASLAQARDFQYLRTIFALDDPLEDGLVFLPDAFIRNLVGPATRIKERRRLEALTSLSMINNGALFTAWETGKLPASHKDLLAYTGLSQTQLVTSEGDQAEWDPLLKQAVSPLYNTRSFATPLIELPIDRVTPAEKAEYERFRQGYLNSWRQYFDPMGFRICLKDGTEKGEKGQARIESFVLPLVENSQFSDLRRLTGDGAVKIDPARFGGKSVFQFLAHFSPNARERKDIGDVFRREGLPDINGLGNWFTIRLDDSPVLQRMVEKRIKCEVNPDLCRDSYIEDLLQLIQLPLTLGVEIRNPLAFNLVLLALRQKLMARWPDTEWAEMKEPYKGIKMAKIKAFTSINLYHALIDGAWYISFRQECIHDLIDASLAAKAAKDEKIEVNAAVHASSAVHVRDALLLSLEWEASRQAVAANSVLHILYRGGVLSVKDDEAAVRRAALQYLGMTPGVAGFADHVYDPARDEIVHKRYGTIRQPRLPMADPKASPLGRLLQDFATLRIELRFRDDGMATVATLQRK